MENAQEGPIVGLPTMMAVFPGRVDVVRLLEALQGTGHPLADVSVYLRVRGTDQVIDAVTGQIAAGQALTQRELHPGVLDDAETLLILHPRQEEVPAIRQALASSGEAKIEYQDATAGLSRTDAAIPHSNLQP